MHDISESCLLCVLCDTFLCCWVIILYFTLYVVSRFSAMHVQCMYFNSACNTVKITATMIQALIQRLQYHGFKALISD